MASKNLLRTAGLAAGLLGLVSLAPSAFAQYQEPQTYWNGASPSAPGPASTNSGPGYNYGPNNGGWAPGAYSAPAAGPYWLGAPNATGPSS
jgi:hypothetical protein